jgi:putative salt-induced outer membrane protein YdiY
MGETWTLANGDKLTGKLVVEDEGAIEIQHPQLGRIKFARSALKAEEKTPTPPVMVTPADTAKVTKQENTPGVKPKSPWKRQVEFGYVMQSGAQEKQDLSSRVQIDGKIRANTFRATAKLVQAELNSKVVTDRRDADFRWRYDFNKRLFAQALTTYAADDVRGIDMNLEQQLGGGYRLLESKRQQVNVGIGAVLQRINREDRPEMTKMLGSFFQDYSLTWNDRLKLTQESNFLLSDETSGLPSSASDSGYRIKFNAALQGRMTTQVTLNLRYDYDYDGAIPNKELRGDARLTTSLGYVW